MCILEMQMQCYGSFFEVLPNERVCAELTVEDGVSQILLELFGGGMVNEVTIHFSSHLHMGLQHCSVHLHALCLCQDFALFPHTRENMKLEVETRICSLLKELFGSVNVVNVAFIPSSCDYENNPALSLNDVVADH